MNAAVPGASTCPAAATLAVVLPLADRDGAALAEAEADPMLLAVPEALSDALGAAGAVAPGEKEGEGPTPVLSADTVAGEVAEGSGVRVGSGVPVGARDADAEPLAEAQALPWLLAEAEALPVPLAAAVPTGGAEMAPELLAAPVLSGEAEVQLEPLVVAVPEGEALAERDGCGDLLGCAEREEEGVGPLEGVADPVRVPRPSDAEATAELVSDSGAVCDAEGEGEAVMDAVREGMGERVREVEVEGEPVGGAERVAQADADSELQADEETEKRDERVAEAEPVGREAVASADMHSENVAMVRTGVAVAGLVMEAVALGEGMLANPLCVALPLPLAEGEGRGDAVAAEVREGLREARLLPLTEGVALELADSAEEREALRVMWLLPLLVDDKEVLRVTRVVPLRVAAGVNVPEPEGVA